MLTQNQVIQLTQAIKDQSNTNSKFYGRLLEWSDITNHYGIGLSDEYLFSTGEFPDLLPMFKYQDKLKLTPTKALKPNLVIERLIYALDCFKDWHYGLLGWNCEHYARLVATNEALSYQVKLSPLAFLNNGGYNPDAVRVF
ncbi:hypothetical protein [Cyanothece sp. BG0011]|uniref:hypothetical protein n=1 Tax=Cyanothece sp. BG0011 TaxID=2082950 RepID=UPI0018E59D89|nr:hypothetical protein [Cyanothece sp. BG0011]